MWASEVSLPFQVYKKRSRFQGSAILCSILYEIFIKYFALSNLSIALEPPARRRVRGEDVSSYYYAHNTHCPSITPAIGKFRLFRCLQSNIIR